MKRIRLLALLLLILLLFSSCKQEPDALLQIYVLDVGQGDCILLRTEAGDILVDTGTEASQELLCLRLEQLGVEELELLILTHPDEDHIGGADGILRGFAVKEVWTNGAESEETCFTAFREAAEETDVIWTAVRAGTACTIGELSFFVMAPRDGDVEGGNEGSIVFKLTCGEISAIFTGDAGIDTEENLLSQYGAAQLDCDIYKVGHHGSNTSSSKDFLEAMSPEYALISSGKGNPYGHPHGDVLESLKRVGARILRVDLEGEILLETDGIKIWQK
ncbi:MAG: MBL fold metallo-hydrolase [Clostridia bacterium]|nr:MBL fold metallo-hydrolase [Clostridia bacterium]